MSPFSNCKYKTAKMAEAAFHSGSFIDEQSEQQNKYILHTQKKYFLVRDWSFCTCDVKCLGKWPPKRTKHTEKKMVDQI